MLSCKEKDNLKAVKKKEGIYIIDIHKFIPVEELAEWASAVKRCAALKK